MRCKTCLAAIPCDGYLGSREWQCLPCTGAVSLSFWHPGSTCSEWTQLLHSLHSTTPRTFLSVLSDLGQHAAARTPGCVLLVRYSEMVTRVPHGVTV